MLTRRKLLELIDARRVHEAVQAAERRTSGEFVISVAPFFGRNAHKVAEQVFVRLGLARTRQRNAVLFFVVPSRRRLVVLGDEGIDGKVPAGFWDDVAALVLERFREGDFTGGLVAGIERTAEELAVHFPFDPDNDVNELPDGIDYGG